ncbi:MAG: hypothetical protein H6Q52_2493 [Deltaproteobacteria bacterium]|nr:hypothetical protein [Deltaproteobacteria bacterium]
MNINDIIVRKRHRVNLGNIEVLKGSISELGLLQPIVIKKGTNELVAGFRRLRALGELGVSELAEGVHIKFIDIESIIRGEYDENVCREEFTVSEKVAIFEALKEEQKKFGITRQLVPGEKLQGNTGPIKKGPDTDFPGRYTAGHTHSADGKEIVRGSASARGHAARAVGLHYNTLRKATEIVSAARKEPARYDHLVKEMDRSGKVEPVFQKYVEERSRPVPDAHGISPAVWKLLSDTGTSIPEVFASALSRIPPRRQEDLLLRYADILRTMKQADIERSFKIVSKDLCIAAMPETEIAKLLGSVLEHTAALAQEWVFLPQVRQTAALIMNVAKTHRSASTLDKLDFFMIGLAGFVDMACNYLKVANKEGILRDIPADALEKYLAAIDAFEMLYDSKLPRQVGAMRIKEKERASADGPANISLPSIRDHVNAMKANEMITNAAEGPIPYYKNLLSGLVRNFHKGAQELETTPVP